MKETYENEYVKSHHEALALFDALGIKEVTSKTQRKNGTRVWELPAKTLYSTGYTDKLKFGIYSSGYIRNCSSSNHSCYQINKKYTHTKKWWNSYYKKYMDFKTTERILIHNEEDRIVYLANYILKNYYRNKTSYQISPYVMDNLPTKTARDYDILLEKYDSLLSDYLTLEKDLCYDISDKLKRDVQVIIDGHRYNLT